MKGLHKRTWGGWEPIDDQAKKILKRYKVGDVVELEHTARRNVKFLRKYFGVINLQTIKTSFERPFKLLLDSGTIKSRLMDQKQSDQIVFHFQKWMISLSKICTIRFSMSA